MKHKKLITTICAIAIMFSTNHLKAQDDANAGIYIDGAFVDSIPCWTFEYMYLVFPINEKYKKYDKVRVCLKQYYPDSRIRGAYRYFKLNTYSPEAFFDTFGDAKYGVWKFLTNKKTDSRECWVEEVNENNIGETYIATYVRKQLSGNGGSFYSTKNVFYELEVSGLVLTGYQDYGNGQKIATYGNGTILYKSNKIPPSYCKKCSWDINAPCVVKGKKVPLKIERSLSYVDELGIIK